MPSPIGAARDTVFPKLVAYNAVDAGNVVNGKSTKGKAYPRPDDRQPRLAARRREKMARSAHAYVRGSASLFYQWLDAQKAGALPEGPAVWIGGDCHLGNLGPVSSAAGHVAVQLRDLDNSVIGNPLHDLLRLGLSLTTAARSADLPGVISSSMIEALADGYEQAFDETRSDITSSTKRPAVVNIAMKEAKHRSWQKMDRQTIDHTGAAIPLGKRFWPLSEDERVAIHALFETEPTRSLIHSALTHPSDASSTKVSVLDAAFWVKGCSSLGRRRYAVLLDIDGTCAKGGPPCLVDIKEAVGSEAPRQDDASMPRDNAKRVLEGARHLTPMLGDRMVAARLDGAAVVIRELMPEDLKLDAENLTEEDAVNAAHFLALVIGQAHSRQMDPQTRRAWLDELKKGRPKTLTSPAWLWRSIVELMVAHERAYLEHCRRYALDRRNR
ncbi:DUF2252 family protein [Paraburkholderia sp. LEh10]|nr:DUF2252 family protein [Paraburkholderia sp. LEh10]